MRNISQDFQTDQIKGERETDKSRLKFGPEQLCEGCTIYKDSSGSLGEEQVCRDGKRGRKDVLRIQSFILSTLISCCPFAVQLEMSGRLLESGTC